MLYLATMDLTRKWTGRIVNWGRGLTGNPAGKRQLVHCPGTGLPLLPVNEQQGSAGNNGILDGKNRRKQKKA
jgi:hypothetical protein